MRYRKYSGYDFKSEAYRMDGGANDEGWHYRYCHTCNKQTEHGRGSGCVPCGDKAARWNRSVRVVKVAGSSETHTVKIYPNGKAYCSCKGFKFRKTCNHVKKV